MPGRCDSSCWVPETLDNKILCASSLRLFSQPQEIPCSRSFFSFYS